MAARLAHRFLSQSSVCPRRQITAPGSRRRAPLITGRARRQTNRTCRPVIRLAAGDAVGRERGGGAGSCRLHPQTSTQGWRRTQLFLTTMTFCSVIARCFQRVRSEQEQRGGEVRQGAPGLRPKRLPHPDQRRPAGKLSSLLTLLPGHEDWRLPGRPGGQSHFYCLHITVSVVFF